MMIAVLKSKVIHTMITLLICFAAQSQEVNVEQKLNVWGDLKSDNLYQNLDGEKIIELLDARPDLLTQADNIYGIQIRKNDVFLFVSSELKVGKLQILSFDEQLKMTIRFTLYDVNSVSTKNKNLLVLEHNKLIDIDKESTKVSDSKDLDFKWGDVENPRLFPQNNISICLLNESRKEN